MTSNSIEEEGMQEIRKPAPRKSLQKQKATAKICSKHVPSSENCYVLIVGPIESGKSTTLNTIFGSREVSPVERQQGTTNILEFKSYKTRFIDTPGFGSFNSSIHYDTQLIATLKQYLDLNLPFHLPNIILLIVRFDDPKLTSDFNPFLKTLKALSLLKNRLFSTEYCNLIVCMTHFMNERKSNRIFPNEKLKIVRGLIRKYLNTSCHIIFGDNQAEDWDLIKVNGTDSFKLPTGDFYPQNLIELISEVGHRSTNVMCTVLENRLHVEVKLIKELVFVREESRRFKKALKSMKWVLGLEKIDENVNKE